MEDGEWKERELDDVPDVLHLIVRSIGIEDSVPGATSARLGRRLPRMVRLRRLPALGRQVPDQYQHHRHHRGTRESGQARNTKE